MISNRKNILRFGFLCILACALGASAVYVIKGDRLGALRPDTEQNRLQMQHDVETARPSVEEAQDVLVGSTDRRHTEPSAQTGKEQARIPQGAIGSSAPPAQPSALDLAVEPGISRRAPAFEFNRMAESTFSPRTADTEVMDESSTAGEIPPSPVLPETTSEHQKSGYIVGQVGDENPGLDFDEDLTDEDRASGSEQEEGLGLASGGSSVSPRQLDTSSDPRIVLIPSNYSILQGQTVRVSVQIDSGLDVSAVPFHVQYDGQVLEFEKAYQGGFLSQDGSSPLLMVAPLQNKNEITVGLSRTGLGPGVNGSGILVTLEFRATGPGTTPIQFSQAKLLNSKRRQVRAEFVSAQIAVR